MKKLLILLLQFLLILPVLEAKSAVFVSRYSSTSMDPVTLDYYDRINDYFSPVFIVQDIEVKKDSLLWRNSYEKADLVFIISLSDESFNKSRNEFCKSLSVILTKVKGIVFAGNSSIVSDSGFGCLYTPYFNLAVASKNEELKNDSVKLIKLHKITQGYIIGKEYHLKDKEFIYTIIKPVGADILGIVNGDPDGLGPMQSENYPFLVVWEGIGHRTGVWGITTSSLTECSNCLGWKLFDQLLGWTSETENIGYKIYTDKEKYYPEERIYIDVKSPADISNVTGYIYYPDGMNSSLSFWGSGKEWQSIYLLNKKDPNGNYTIEVLADGVKKIKTISVNAFELNINVNNQTRNVTIDIKATDKYGKVVSVDLSVKITSPSNIVNSYYFEDDGSISLTYLVTESGVHLIYISATDAFNRSLSMKGNFYFYFRPNITLFPEQIKEKVYGPKNFSKSIIVLNVGNYSATNFNITKSGVIMDWIELENISLGKIEPNESKTLRLNISVPEVEKGEYNGIIKFSFDSEEYFLPITILMKYPGNLSVQPEQWSGWIPKGRSKKVQFLFSNNGKGEVIIESLNLTGDLKDKASIIKGVSKVDPGLSELLEIEIRTEDVLIKDFIKELNGNLKIATDLGVYYPPVSLKVIVIKDLEQEADKLLKELKELEKNITFLEKVMDVSYLKKYKASIESDLNQVKSLYEQEKYEDAITPFRSARSSIEDLRKEVFKELKEKEEREKMYSLAVVLFLISIAIMVIIFFSFKRIVKEKKYKWLYEKWKRST